jgi:hypothetical protein
MEKFLRRAISGDFYKNLDRFGREGVAALANATPVDSGLTASSWTYEIEQGSGSVSITWLNTNTVSGVNVAIILQYGHGTGTGGYVQGQDYINPVIKPLFDRIAEDVWKAVTSA